MLAAGTSIGAYEILAPIGAGGMGEVYRARDVRLDREVAIKVLSGPMARDPTSVSHFEREARAIAALSHSNILAIHEFNQHEGLYFAVTELLDGETLRNRISSAVLPWRKAVEIAIAIAEGLAAAHSRQIIHRDLKPENIFLTRAGQVKILDFGLAHMSHVIPSVVGMTSERETESVPLAGTVPYMAPEQLIGEIADQRSDIFSFGCILYEMLNGVRPFHHETVWETASAIMNAPPEEFAGAAVPEELQRLVLHCLEKKPDERFQAAGDIVFDLKTLQQNSGGLGSKPRSEAIQLRPLFRLIVVAVLLVAAGIFFYWRLGVRETVRSLAVLPLLNETRDPDLEYLGNGISEDITNKLAQARNLRVMARSTVFQYQGNVDARKVGRELKVDAVLTGSLKQDGDQLMISVELVRAKDGSSIWGKHFSRSPSDILDVQDTVSHEIAGRLQLELTGEQERRMTKRHTDNAGAYQSYLKGRYYTNKRTPEGIHTGMNYFQQAIDQDPLYALAYAGLADGYALLGDYALLPPKEAYSMARAAAQQALALDEQLAEAHTALGHVQLNLWNIRAAGAEYRRAIQINPNYAQAYQWHANYLMATGKTQEALENIRKAVELDPLTLITNSVYGWELYLARKYQEAEVQLRRTLELDQNFAPAHATLGDVLMSEKRYTEAIACFEKAIQIAPDITDYRASLAYAYATSGRKQRAIELLRELQDGAGKAYVSPVYLAFVYTANGEQATAIQLLHRAYSERSEFLLFIGVYPPFDPLRTNPEFRQILRQVGLPD